MVWPPRLVRPSLVHTVRTCLPSMRQRRFGPLIGCSAALMPSSRELSLSWSVKMGVPARSPMTEMEAFTHSVISEYVLFRHIYPRVDPGCHPDPSSVSLRDCRTGNLPEYPVVVPTMAAYTFAWQLTASRCAASSLLHQRASSSPLLPSVWSAQLQLTSRRVQLWQP